MDNEQQPVDETTPESDAASEQSTEQASTATEPSSNDQSTAKHPDYAQLVDSRTNTGDKSLGRFFDVEVTISAELGRVSMPIGDVVKLGEGSVIDLDRPISSPVDVMAQGVRIATGEVVVIDDSFAVRIKEIDSENLE